MRSVLCSKEKVADAEVFVWCVCASTGIANAAGHDRLTQCFDEWVNRSRAADEWDDDRFTAIDGASRVDTLFDHRVSWINTPGALATEVMHLNISKTMVNKVFLQSRNHGFWVHIRDETEVHFRHRFGREDGFSAFALPAASDSTNRSGWFKHLLNLRIHTADIPKEIRHVVLSEQ
jgi:hypothetical protein